MQSPFAWRGKEVVDETTILPAMPANEHEYVMFSCYQNELL
ncbi:hypothetical protein OAP38_04500 [Opitutales bacterium]|nr:hypothetical protein [Opitutales bacterium]